MRSSSSATSSARRPTGPLPWLSWWYSLVFVAAVFSVVATVIYHSMTSSSDDIHLRVVDTAGAPIVGATIKIGDLQLVTEDDGTAKLPAVDQSSSFFAEREGFDTVSGTVYPDGCTRCEITMRPVQTGQVEANAPPLTPEPSVEAVVVPTSPSTPDSASGPGLDQSATTVASATQSAGTGEIAGKILDPSGKPIQGARVVSGDNWDVTGKDGIYQLDRAKVDASRPLTIFASGYLDQQVPIPAPGTALDVSLELFMVKGIYYNPNISNTPEDLDRLIDLINTTEVNAIVIDVKEEIVYYDTQVALFRDSGVIQPILDLPELLKRLKDNGIYTIARQVVFKDGLVAEENPELAVLDVNTGDLWRDMNDVAWVNPTSEGLWKANADMAVELANLGFDEIQYDYVRFPTDGDLETMDFGVEYNQANREAAIGGFLKLSHEMLIPTGAKLSADVFGYTMLVEDDLGIGQNFAELAGDLDFLSPMVYPSHYGESALGYSPPNDYPYELISDSMELAVDKLDGNGLPIRPWLQDFDFPGMTPYGKEEVRAQIDAVEENGGSGWLLWDPDNVYTKEALNPDPSASIPDDNDPAVASAVQATLIERKVSARRHQSLTTRS